VGNKCNLVLFRTSCDRHLRNLARPDSAFPRHVSSFSDDMVDFLCSKISNFDVPRIHPIPKNSPNRPCAHGSMTIPRIHHLYWYTVTYQRDAVKYLTLRSNQSKCNTLHCYGICLGPVSYGKPSSEECHPNWHCGKAFVGGMPSESVLLESLHWRNAIRISITGSLHRRNAIRIGITVEVKEN
jgi:hypothetical protein